MPMRPQAIVENATLTGPPVKITARSCWINNGALGRTLNRSRYSDDSQQSSRTLPREFGNPWKAQPRHHGLTTGGRRGRRRHGNSWSA